MPNSRPQPELPKHNYLGYIRNLNRYALSLRKGIIPIKGRQAAPDFDLIGKGISPAARQIGLALKCLRKRPISDHPAGIPAKRFVFRPEATAHKQWSQLFRLPIGSGNNSHFPFGAKLGAIAYYEIFDQLGFPLTQLRHLKWEIDIQHLYTFGQDYQCTLRLEKLERFGDQSIVFVIHAHIKDSEGRTISTQRDYFHIRNASSQLVNAAQDSTLRHEIISEKRVITKQAANGSVVKTTVPARAGLNYALVANDYNLVHIVPGLQRLFGEKQNFVQGMYTANLVLGTLLTDQAIQVPLRFSMSFTKPVVERASYELKACGESFVFMKGDTLLAYGQCTPTVLEQPLSSTDTRLSRRP